VSHTEQFVGFNLTYNLTIENPFKQGNLTNISILLDTDFQCSSIYGTNVNITEIEDSELISYNCYIPQNLTQGNYKISANITYINPNNRTHVKTNYAEKTILVKRIITKSYERHFYVADG
jgi:hypothetical protein